MTFNSTLGGSTSNSYISVAEADLILNASFKATDWAALTQSDKEISLQQATRQLEYLLYVGERCYPSTDDEAEHQALQWPRSGASCRGVTANCAAIPLPIKQACAYLALDLYSAGGELGDAPSGTQGPIKRQKLGELEQEFFEPGGTDTKVDPKAPILLQTYPWLADVLGCWLIDAGTGSRVILRVRS